MATVPFEFECDKASGFVRDPNDHKCVGYITDLHGFGISAPFAKDITVTLPFNNVAAPTYTRIAPALSSGPTQMTIKVVGVLEKFTWDGSVGGALELDFWASQENAFQIKSLQQTTLKSTIVDPLGWWIADFDQETKQWYEKSYPLGAGMVAGTVANKENPELNVDTRGEFVKDGIDVLAYKISMKVVPGANKEYAIQMANASNKPVAKQWGLIIGTLSSAQYKNV